MHRTPIVLNSKQIKQVHAQLADQFGFTGKIDQVFLLNEKKEKISLFSKDLVGIDVTQLRYDTMGMYFAAYVKEKLRLTIEGTQLIGPQCTKNVVAIEYPMMQRWLQGESFALTELDAELEQGAFVILRCKNDYLGCGKVAGEQLLNYIPKTRYIHALYE